MLHIFKCQFMIVNNGILKRLLLQQGIMNTNRVNTHIVSCVVCGGRRPLLLLLSHVKHLPRKEMLATKSTNRDIS